MTRRHEKPDVNKVLAGLKDFQRRTVDYVFDRMYNPTDPTRRFLIADEVGLGKTLVARGVVARAIDHLWDKVPRIDIVYICSNGDIARQNIARLNITEDRDFSLPSRITMFPTCVHDLKANKLNFVSFTPGTSFDLRSSTGISDERALLYRLLCEPWALQGRAPVNVFRVDMLAGNFDNRCRRMLSPETKVDASVEAGFLKDLEFRIATEKREGKPDIRSRFERLCEVFYRYDARVSLEDYQERNRVIGELRILLASSCLEALEPDLIIMDEFQRFRHLLTGDNEAAILAQDLFQYSDGHSRAHVLLLSATPYKMLTLSHETEQDDHYADFLTTLGFLQDNKSETDAFKDILDDYRGRMLKLGQEPDDGLLDVKQKMEDRLRRVMVRTERLAATTDRDGMLKQVGAAHVSLMPQDLHAFIKQERVADELSNGTTVEYWKSAPYLLNFMDDYVLKRDFLRDVESGQTDKLASLLADRKHLLLRWSEVSKYRQCDPGNARLRSLMADTVDKGAWKLLWMPPSLPYYQLAGPYAEPSLVGITKRLVFSCWKVVPKVISALVSYEAERNSILLFEPDGSNDERARKTRRPLLRFARSDGRLTGMAVLGMIYPSITLARCGDPLKVVSGLDHSGGVPSAEDVVVTVRRDIEAMLAKLNVPTTTTGAEDERWYWAAPILLDLFSHREPAADWFSQEDLVQAWRRYSSQDEEPSEESRWADHVEEARDLILKYRQKKLSLGKRPADLGHVLALMAVAGPGPCCLRALSRLSASTAALSDPVARNEAGAMAYAFLSLFNVPESMGLIRGMNRREPYWLRVTEYCRDGGLQAVLDEYVHMLRESLGVFDHPFKEACADIAEEIAGAVSMRTSRVGVDHIRVKDESGIDITRKNMRVRFALRYGTERSDDEEQVTRTDQVRSAFNSPFWPFVLATTSVGQEGLDFHLYCHAVMHWNLPSNPVDLEQREGRIHRYKGYAVRKNLARVFGQAAFKGTSPDPWDAIFRTAVSNRPAGATDLNPFWVFPIQDGAFIERHVPLLPMSRDVQCFEDLKRSLVAYRMVFGQPRQEDMLAFLLKYIPSSDVERFIQQMQIRLEPPDGMIS
jgi:hypothetical protein